MRYKVKTPNATVLRDVIGELEGKVPIFIVSEKRCLLSTGDLSNHLIQDIQSRGAEVTPDYQYEPDVASRPD